MCLTGSALIHCDPTGFISYQNQTTAMKKPLCVDSGFLPNTDREIRLSVQHCYRVTGWKILVHDRHALVCKAHVEIGSQTREERNKTAIRQYVFESEVSQKSQPGRILQRAKHYQVFRDGNMTCVYREWPK